jgi:RNA polymerase sigma-70 factor (ECF subfamily)
MRIGMAVFTAPPTGRGSGIGMTSVNRDSSVSEPATAPEGEHRDRELLRRIGLKDRHALESLYRVYHGRLARFLDRVSARKELIDEVINEVFWIVWQKAEEFRGDAKVSTWLLGIAYRCMLKALRQADGIGDVTLDDSLPIAAAGDFSADQERREWVSIGLSRLTLDQRSVLELAYYLGHSLEEIAEILSCPVSTVKARMFHARVKLRNLLPVIGGLQEGECT